MKETAIVLEVSKLTGHILLGQYHLRRCHTDNHSSVPSRHCLSPDRSKSRRLSAISV